jgi:hypothetical protein
MRLQYQQVCVVRAERVSVKPVRITTVQCSVFSATRLYNVTWLYSHCTAPEVVQSQYTGQRQAIFCTLYACSNKRAL